MHNKSVTGPAEATERVKNAADEAGDDARGAFASVADGAQRTMDEANEAAQEFASEAYDHVGDVIRSGEDYIRRQPIKSAAIAAFVAFMAGYMVRR